MEKSETIGALAAALAKAQGAMDSAKKDATNPQFRGGKYADFAAVVDAIRKPLADNELAYSQVAGTTPEGLILVETILMHSSGEWLAGTLAMQPTAVRQGGAVVSIPPGEMTPHVIGSVITYARRYGLQAMVGIPADDDDGNAASGKDTEKPKPALQRAPERVPTAPEKPATTAAGAPPATSATLSTLVIGPMTAVQKKRIWDAAGQGLGWNLEKLETMAKGTFDGREIGSLNREEADQLSGLLADLMDAAAKGAKT